MGVSTHENSRVVGGAGLIVVLAEELRWEVAADVSAVKRAGTNRFILACVPCCLGQEVCGPKAARHKECFCTHKVAQGTETGIQCFGSTFVAHQPPVIVFPI